MHPNSNPDHNFLRIAMAAGAKARTEGRSRDDNPFAQLLLAQKKGTPPATTWARRSAAWFEGWDEAGE